jgi:iron complex outermembrane recepter protein
MAEDFMRFKLKLLAGTIALAGFIAAPALAQDAPAASADDGEEIIVTGIRGSLAASAELKRNSTQIVDAVSAEDVGKFPDGNIAESLQRITGVAIDRTGGEGQFITVRGLGPEFNNVLVNGRTLATDNAGREFSFDVLSSDIIQRSEVYKSSQANLIEGGIGATVNIATAKPFDFRKTRISLSAGGIYDTLAEKVSPEASGVFTTQNDAQTIGVLFSLSYSNRKSQRDFVDINGFIRGPELVINAPATATGLTTASVSRLANVDIARNLNYNRAQEERERLVGTAAVQFKPTDRVLLTVDGLYSKFDVKSPRNFFAGFFTEPFINPTVNANGTVTGFNRPGSDFLAANPLLVAAGVSLSQNDNVVTSNDRFTKTYQIGGNLKFDATDNLKLELDVSKSNAKQKAFNPFVVVGSLATTAPRFDLNPNGGLPLFTNLGNVTDPNLQRVHFATISDNRVEDDIDEVRLEGTWKTDVSILKSLNAGGYYLNRRKVNKIANTGSEAFCAYCGYNLPVNPALISPFKLDNFLKGVNGSNQVPSNFFTFDPFAVLAFLSNPVNINNPLRQPSLSPADFAADSARLLALPGGVYTPRARPGESLDVEEDVQAAFFNATLGGERWSGNIGLRVIRTKTTSRGFQVPVINITTLPGDDNLQFTFGPAAPVISRNRYTNFLPSGNFKFDIDDNKLIRLAVSKTVTRPTLTSLGTNNFFQGRTTAPLSGGGNPQLEPFVSWNYDASAEWYIDKVSFASIAVFHKSFSNFLETQTLIVPQFGFNFQDTRTRNGEKGRITGVEVGGQYAIDDGALKGFGVAGNYTYVTSKVKRAPGSAVLGCDYEGLSPNSFNVSGFYERGRVSARLSYNWRDSFFRRCQGQQARPENRDVFAQTDFSLGFNINDNFQVYGEGVNIFGADTKDFSVLKERFLLRENTGSRYNFGVRAKF